MLIKNNKIYKILLIAFIVRVIMLAIIFLVTPKWSAGFIGNTVFQDDFRYEAGAILYSKTANSIIDFDAFSFAYANYGDYVGYVKNIFSATPLWYWIVCVVYYIFKSIVVIRLLNIIFSILSIYVLYKLLNKYYNDQIAIVAAKLLAFLPYPVIFSCFSYKDNLVMLLTISLLYLSLCFRLNKDFNIKKMLFFIFISLLLLLVRGGLSAILIGLCFIIAFLTKDNLEKKKFFQLTVLIIVSFIAILFVFANSLSSIGLKIHSYITARDVSQLGLISLVTITKISDIYKLPFTFLFAIVMPIGFNNDIASWYNIVGIINICMAPISIGAFIDIFYRAKKEWVFIGCCLVYYFISIIASIGIFRHYYSLLFIPIMLFSHLYCDCNLSIKKCWLVGSYFYIALLSIYLFI